jgi:error-prone DNA polymerase
MPYVELHCHSVFSFLDGASHPDELAARAAEQGHVALALTDHDGLHGAMAFAQAAKPLGVRPITGAELTLEDGSHLTLLCQDQAGYRNLCRLITEAHRGTRLWEMGVDGRPHRGPRLRRGDFLGASSRTTLDPHPPSVALDFLERHAEGLVCLSGCAREGALAGRVERGDLAGAEAMGRRLVAAFGRERFRVELQRPLWRHDRGRNRLLAGLAERLRVPCVATGGVHMHDRSRGPLQDALSAVRLGIPLDESEPRRRGNHSHVLTPPQEMAGRFGDWPEAVDEAGRVAERLEFDLTRDLGYRYPGAEDVSAGRRLAELCRARLGERYARSSRRDDAERRLDEELALIGQLGLAGFFLLHHDLLELAAEVAVEVRGDSMARQLLPPGRGRGSSVSSIVCYLTGLSHIDPIESDLHLGRFLNEELTALPDIDLDFPRDIREKLIPRVHERYGHERSALVAALATYRPKSAIRDFGKALGLPAGEIERAARSADFWTSETLDRDLVEAIGPARASSPRWRWLRRLVREAGGMPRHVSQHPGGMVISTEPLIDICPVQPAAMEGRQMVQWDKDSCADAGFLKIDLLGLGMLSAVERAVDLIAKARGERIDLSRIPFDDPQVYEAIQGAETTGVFQIESRAQMQMLRRTRPESLDDLTVQVALVRPGPIQGGAVNPYIRNREALRQDPDFRVEYAHPSLEPVLRDTLGTIVFQDQVLEVSMALAGFSPGEAEGLRRAMSRRRSEAAMRAYEERFVEGAMGRGVSREVAERVYSQIVGFSGFGFPKAHAAAFGLLAYQSTWLRVRYPAEFLCALLNEQPMGFYPPDALVHEAQRRGIEVLPADVERSEVECGVEGGAVRIGLGFVLGVRKEEVEGLVAERQRGGRFQSLADLAARCAVVRDSLERLAWAGACDCLCDDGRREALWLLGITAAATALASPVERSREAGSSSVQLALPLDPGTAPALPRVSDWERLAADYASTGMSLDLHPMQLMRPGLAPEVIASRDLEEVGHGERVRVAGMVVARQRPATANGILFVLLEDESGTINLIVPPPVFERHRLVARTEPILEAEGRLERLAGNVNIVVSSLRRLERPDVPLADVRHLEPPVPGHRPDARPGRGDQEDLRPLLPAAHSFGRRGR